MLTYKAAIEMCAREYANAYYGGSEWPQSESAVAVAKIFEVPLKTVEKDLEKIRNKVMEQVRTGKYNLK